MARLIFTPAIHGIKCDLFIKVTKLNFTINKQNLFLKPQVLFYFMGVRSQRLIVVYDMICLKDYEKPQKVKQNQQRYKRLTISMLTSVLFQC